MESEKPIVLEVEGVDCVGKTTLAKTIAAQYGFQYLYTPQVPLAVIRKEIEALDDPDTRFFYYLTSVIAVQRMIRSYIEAGKSLVIDRYIRSTFVMHRTLGVDVSCVEVDRLPIVRPEFSVLLTADRETRAARRSRREGVSEYDQKIEQSEGLLDSAQNTFLNIRPWSLVVETSSLSPEQVAEQVGALLIGA